MRVFANLFLVLFLADGSISLLEELVSLLAPVAPLSGARDLLGAAVITMAALVYLCLGIDRRLPKRVFLPLIFFVFWCPLSILLFPSLGGHPAYAPAMAATQIVLGLLLSRFRKGREYSLTMPAAMFHAPWFSLRNTLLFGGGSVLVIPVALVLLGFYAVNSYMTQHAACFMRLGRDGLYMTDRSYRRDHRTIRLASMIHVGDKRYYDELAGSIPKGRTIILAEGVTDEKQLVQNRFDYKGVAGVLGLTSQDKMVFRGRLIDAEALDKAPGGKKGAGQVDIVRADVDVSAFRPPTILLLDNIGKHLQGPSTTRSFLSLNRWAGKNITPQMYDIIMDDILHRRNREVTRYLDKALVRYDTVVIPWGALHMKGIEEEVLKRGFKLQEERERLSIDFRKMLLVISKK